MKIHADNVPTEAPRLRVFMSRKRAGIILNSLKNFDEIIEGIKDEFFVFPLMLNREEIHSWIKALGDALGE